jgi:hypothetical protein
MARPRQGDSFDDHFCLASRWLEPMSEECVTVTSDPDAAYQWPSVEDALATYRETLLIEPIRHDGKLNRPLTALNVLIAELVGAGS